eukprot:9288725-Ditylum_brightwellii.AAC.1
MRISLCYQGILALNALLPRNFIPAYGNSNMSCVTCSLDYITTDLYKKQRGSSSLTEETSSLFCIKMQDDTNIAITQKI